jgi:hypothetical protein
MEWSADKVERQPIDPLIPYARNARTHSDEQVAQIAASIKEWGWTIPILTDEEGGIIAGHGRVLAARKLGLTEAPVMVARGWTKTQKQAYILADNKLTLNAGWDDDLLRVEPADLEELGFDLSLTGFSEQEMAALSIVEGLTDPDEAPPLPSHPVSQPGDGWILDRHRLVCGDCTMAGTVAHALHWVKPDLMVTDPPYGVEYDPAWRNEAGRSVNGTVQRLKSGKAARPLGARALGKVTNDDRADWSEAWRLFPGAVAYVWHAGTKAGTVQASLEGCGFDIPGADRLGQEQLCDQPGALPRQARTLLVISESCKVSGMCNCASAPVST